MFKYIVIGKGMIGSAAAKYLSSAQDGVAAIGPDEPADFKAHNGVFASHYDSGRITRILDTQYIWGLAAKRSIEMYPVIEEKSGVKFFHPTGCVKVVADTEKGRAYLDANEEVGGRLGAVTERLTTPELKSQWSFLVFPSNSIAITEQATAGWIDPRKLVEAQLLLAKTNGASSINDTVVKVTRSNASFEVETASGQKHLTEKVIVAAGGFANFNGLLPRELDITPRAETIMRAQLTTAQAQEFATMPSVIWFLEGRKNLKYVYVVPPVLYPDGNYWIKMGGDREVDNEFTSLEQLNNWFHTDGGTDAAADFKAIMEQMLPSLRAENWISKPCVITDTATERPYIDFVEDGLLVATGGCGAAAKSSDEFGRLAALKVQGQGEPSYEANSFKAVYKGIPDPTISKREFQF